MTALTADRQTKSRVGADPHPVAASEIIYKGAIVCINAAGNLIAAADAAGNQVMGVAAEHADNSAGSAGDVSCAVESGRSFLLTASGMALTDVGSTVYITDDNLVTTTAPTNGTRVGRITGFKSATEIWVFIPEGGCVAGLADATWGANDVAIVNSLLG